MSDQIFGMHTCSWCARRLTILYKQDDHNAEEDWDKTVSTEKALTYIEGWEPFLTELIKATPNNRCTDWKLLWRNPQPKWHSPKARVIQLGDSAHSFLPTSGSGAAMAMEDAYSLATCLQLGGKSNFALAVRVHNRLRYVVNELDSSKKSYTYLTYVGLNVYHALKRWDSTTGRNSTTPTGMQ